MSGSCSDSIRSVCIECGQGVVYIRESGKTVCGDCGLIQDREGSRVVYERVFRNFEVGSFTVFRPSSGRRYASFVSWKKRFLRRVFGQMSLIADRLHIRRPVMNRGMYFFDSIHRKNLIRKRYAELILRSCLLLACRERKMPFSVSDFSDDSVRVGDVVRCVYEIRIILSLKTHSLDATMLVPRYCSELGLSGKETDVIVSSLENVYSLRFQGKDPRGLIGAVIFASVGGKGTKINKEKIARVVGVTSNTIRARLKEIECSS